MSYAESDYCPYEEYEAHRETRIQAFGGDGLYFAMLALKRVGDEDKRAAKTPAELRELRRVG